MTGSALPLRVTMRLGLNGATTGEADLLTDAAAARRAGFDCLEVRAEKIERYLTGGTLESLRAALEAGGVPVLSLNAMEDCTLVPPARWPLALARCRQMCAWARALGCPYIVAVPSPRPAGMDEATVVVRTRQALLELAAIAADHGVRVGFEFLGFAWCSVSTLGFARHIVEGMGEPGVGLVVDTFHYYIGGSAPRDLEGLDPSRLFVVHLDDAEDRPRETLTDAHRLMPGKGAIPLRPLLARLSSLGFRGPYSVELFRPEYWAMDPYEVARRAKESAERILSGG